MWWVGGKRISIALENFSITMYLGGFYFLKGFIFSEAFYFNKIISSASHPLSEVSNSYFVDYHCTVS